MAKVAQPRPRVPGLTRRRRAARKPATGAVCLASGASGERPSVLPPPAERSGPRRFVRLWCGVGKPPALPAPGGTPRTGRIGGVEAARGKPPGQPPPRLRGTNAGAEGAGARPVGVAHVPRQCGGRTW
jgi:hypothetical protein